MSINDYTFTSYITVGGTHELRMSEALRAIDSLLVFEPLKEREN
ncbi:hypothetical protein [Microcoleus sp. D2_18a_B4]